ncbi:endo-1,4-beta-xylanase [Phenylobacterium sp. LjRoot225]|uniref:endo-1,4-beta-xylanase n=1 Tax=Phenylobacterium sp. LjRoot225 TaxID=3342285 RepID=UPI003ECE2D6F
MGQINRRSFLAVSAAALTLPDHASSTELPALGPLARAAGLEFGSAVGPWLWREADFRAAVLRDCTAIVPEYEWKWDYLTRAGRRTDLEPIRRYLAFAEKNGLALRGHTLVWHGAMPHWYPAAADRQEALTLMTGHVTDLVGSARGRVRRWDVVNEAIEPADGEPDGLRRTPLLAQIGRDYIEIAFRAAAAADPTARLVYNDYGLGASWGAARRDAVLRLVEHLVERGAPIHGVGVQSHLAAGDGYDGDGLAVFAARLREMGLEILVSELDVSDTARRGAPDREVAAIYAHYLATVVEIPNLTAIHTWGLSDRHSWIRAKAGAENERPLPYDRAMRPKPAWEAIAGALRRRAAEHGRLTS